MIEEMLSIDHEMMNMEHEMTDMHDEKMGMEGDMNKMMSMHHQMMDMDDDAMKYEHCMHHMNKDNYEEHETSKMEEEENMGYTHEMYMPEEDDKNYEKKPCNCKNKMSEEYRFEFNNINCRVVSIDDILK